MEASDRARVEHQVEGRDLIDADRRHAQPERHRVHRRARHPGAAGAARHLPLRDVEQRHHRACLPPRRIFRDADRDRRLALGIEREARGLIETSPGQPLPKSSAMRYRSTSPNTRSSEPMIATVSASMCRRAITSIACRKANPVGRILQRYGRLLPSATR